MKPYSTSSIGAVQDSRLLLPSEKRATKCASGILNGKTTGTPIGFIIENENQHSADYAHIAEVYRPSHADYVYQQKYGIRDVRGGGRSSARETVSRVVAGAIAKQVLKEIQINAYVSSVGELSLTKPYTDLDLAIAEPMPCAVPILF